MKAVLKGAWVEVAEPLATDGETIVEVHAAGVNRADLLQIAGFYPPPPGAPETLGLEAAGIDTETGKRVCFLLAGGGMAERVAVDRRLLMPIPDQWSFVDAAAVPEAYLTAYSNVFERGRLAKGEWLLVHAVTSGVGMAAVQMAALHGCQVIGTGRNADKLKALKIATIDTSKEDFAERARALTAGKGVDVILDMLGGDALGKNIKALADDGRIAVIALMQGTSAELDMRALLSRRLTIGGATLRARPVDEKARLTSAFVSAFYSRVTPLVDSQFEFAQCADAFARMHANTNVGKIVLSK